MNCEHPAYIERAHRYGIYIYSNSGKLRANRKYKYQFMASVNGCMVDVCAHTFKAATRFIGRANQSWRIAVSHLLGILIYMLCSTCGCPLPANWDQETSIERVKGGTYGLVPFDYTGSDRIRAYMNVYLPGFFRHGAHTRQLPITLCSYSTTDRLHSSLIPINQLAIFFFVHFFGLPFRPKKFEL